MSCHNLHCAACCAVHVLQRRRLRRQGSLPGPLRAQRAARLRRTAIQPRLTGGLPHEAPEGRAQDAWASKQLYAQTHQLYDTVESGPLLTGGLPTLKRPVEGPVEEALEVVRIPGRPIPKSAASWAAATCGWGAREKGGPE